MNGHSSSNNKSNNPLAGLERSVGKPLMEKIQSCKLLVVGSGGIGCELLKDLALSGFRNVEVIDLDTIDVSNLNRQLLFRAQHVGNAKCIVACEVATTMVPASPDQNSELQKVSYQAHHGNVCNTDKFHVEFMKQFDLVLNALDNVEARRRVNRLCLAAKIPLVEAGTTGYLGQVTVISSPDTSCYECRTQETQKVYPICTIRSTPSMPVHTIVWSKELYKLLCHSKVEESMLYEGPGSEDDDGDNGGNGEGSGEPSTYMDSVTKVRELLSSTSGKDKESLKQAGIDLLKALYETEIQKQLDMGRYKAAKKTPTPLPMATIESGSNASSGTTSTGDTTSIWSLEECVSEFQSCLQEALERRGDNEVVLEEFDKDDDLCMRFVTATSNLRSHVFGIEPLQSLYSAKGIAGNIIPAIATTNAICAGIQILQAFNILKAKIEVKEGEHVNLKTACQYVNCIRNKTRNGLYLTASTLESPNPNCFVCKNAVIPLKINIEQWTLEDFLKRIIKGRLGFESPTLLLGGDFIWEEGDGAEEDYQQNLSKTLSKLPCGGIHNGTVLEIDDATQNLTIQISITNMESWDDYPDQAELEFPFLVGSVPPTPKPSVATAAAPAAAPASTKQAAVASLDDDDDIVVVSDTTANKKEDDVVMLLDDSDDDEEDNAKKPSHVSNGNKRPATVDSDEEPAAKKSKL